ncbi:unnamed protein product [Prorocentrum cordatum]|uniref:Kinesin motor domain-containing protein n=1 Tax=Prorocentrum cordatum TaxID=2364126 RepID=A0ABN9PDQ9_9DINO|nr:unnamed protein product [Polarella glacialis]
MQPGHDSIKVCVRVRPINATEKRNGASEAVRCAGERGGSLQLVPRGRKPVVHSFDHVLAPACGQDQVFEHLGQPVVQSVVNGFHGCVFAYGQTGAGKSHTVFGGGSGDRGLLPRIAEGLFLQLARETQDEHMVRLSYLELYNEKVRDLLQAAPSQGRGLREPASLEIREHPRFGVFIEGLTKSTVQSAADVSQLLDFGHKIRVVGCTNMNAVSSRSHAVVTLHVERKVVGTAQAALRRAHLHAVDLAGSERMKQLGNNEQRQKESQQINKSLAALSHMISCLAAREHKGAKSDTHIPYRNSKLTFLLSGSLMGNCRTAMLACISPSADCLEMTESTIRFAESVKKLHTKPVQNEEFEADLIRMLQAEIETLKQQLQSTAASSDVGRDIQDQIQATQGIQQEFTRSWDAERRLAVEANRQRRMTLGSCLSAASKEGGPAAASPYLVTVCDDPLLSGRMRYWLTPGKVLLIGSDPACDICIDGMGTQPETCSVRCVDNCTLEVHRSSQQPSQSPLLPTAGGELPKTMSMPNRRSEAGTRSLAEVSVNMGRVVGQARLEDGDRLRVGLAHCFQVVIPEARNPHREKVMSIVDQITVENSTQSLMAKEYVSHLQDRIGAERAAGVLRRLQDLKRLTDEANETTEEMRDDKDFEMAFEVRVLYDITGSDKENELAVVLRRTELPDDVTRAGPQWAQPDSGSNALCAVWSEAEFRARLEALRDLRREVDARPAPWGEPGDPDPWSLELQIPTVEGPQEAGEPGPARRVRQAAAQAARAEAEAAALREELARARERLSAQALELEALRAAGAPAAVGPGSPRGAPARRSFAALPEAGRGGPSRLAAPAAARAPFGASSPRGAASPRAPASLTAASVRLLSPRSPQEPARSGRALSASSRGSLGSPRGGASVASRGGGSVTSLQAKGGARRPAPSVQSGPAARGHLSPGHAAPSATPRAAATSPSRGGAGRAGSAARASSSIRIRPGETFGTKKIWARSEQMGSEDRAASPMHRRCGSMWSPCFPTPTTPMHRRRRRCIADASPRHRRCIGDTARSSTPIYPDPI